MLMERGVPRAEGRWLNRSVSGGRLLAVVADTGDPKTVLQHCLQAVRDDLI
jgi:hypothetical protein